MQQPASISLATHAMGTRFELLLEAGDMPVAQLRAIGEAVVEDVLWWHARLSAFEPSSVVAALMRTGGTGVWTPLDTRLEAALRHAELMRQITSGALDVSWRTRAAGPEDRIEFEPGRARLSRQGQSLDLGCLGKGLALDAAAELLCEHGFLGPGRRALLHGGTSSVLAIGAWRVGVRTGEANEAPTIETLDLLDQHLSVSSNAHRAHVTTRRSSKSSSSGINIAAVICPLVAPERRDNQSLAGIGGGVLAELWSTAILAGADVSAAPVQVKALSW